MVEGLGWQVWSLGFGVGALGGLGVYTCRVKDLGLNPISRMLGISFFSALAQALGGGGISQQGSRKDFVKTLLYNR